MAVTCEQAALRFEKRAQELRAKGAHEAAHDWQRNANTLRSLGGTAEKMPAARKAKR